MTGDDQGETISRRRMAGTSAAPLPSWQTVLRDLRHELRTPINHIVGYSELLLEIADELGHDDLLPDLERIRAAGRELGALVNESLDAASSQTRLPDTVSLSRALRTPLNTIVGFSELLAEDVDAAGYAALLPDLQRIKTASRHLRGQVHAMLDLVVSEVDDDGSPPDARATEPAKMSPSPASPTLPAAPARQLRVDPSTTMLLVVDDDEANRDMLSRRLKRLGYRVALAEHGREALTRLAEQPIDLILLDIVMPELNGYEVLLRLKTSDELRHVPVLVLSASDELDTAVRCIELGAEDYLPKPIDSVLLRARIGACLEKKRLHDQEQRHLATIEQMASELSEWNRTLEQRVQDGLARLERADRLKQFLPRQVAEQIVTTGDESLLESHRRYISVVFCDLRGFTPLSETAEPEEVMTILQEYHRAIGELVADFGGTVEHFAGDGLMVFFNDPQDCPEPEFQAVRLAVAMRDRMLTVCESWRERDYQFGFGVGVSAGYATLGCIGFEGRFHYGAIGSIVNLAARLCGEARDGQILINARARAALGDCVEAEPLPDLTLKGFSRPVRAFAVVSAVSQINAGAVGRISGGTEQREHRGKDD
jgi:class 3 adenylate cyclase/CheY-like chemotaxis protein